MVFFRYFGDCIPFEKFFERLDNLIKKFLGFIIGHRTAIWTGFVKVLTYIKEAVTGECSQEFLVDYMRVLDFWDIKELQRVLEGHPYDTLTFEGGNIDKGVAWYIFRAHGLAAKYAGLCGDRLKIMIERIVRNYMWEVREIWVDVFVETATPTMLRFGIAASKQGEKELEKKCQEKASAEKKKPKEEVTTLFDDED